MLIGTIDLYHFIPLTDLDLAWGSQGQHKAKPISFIFSHSSDCDEIHVVMKQSKLNILRLLLSKIYWNKGNNCCFTDCIKKKKPKHWHAIGWDLGLSGRQPLGLSLSKGLSSNTGMHSDVFEWICFKRGVMVDTVVLYILILSLTLIQGHRSARKQNFLWQLSHKFVIWFGWNLFYY